MIKPPQKETPKSSLLMTTALCSLIVSTAHAQTAPAPTTLPQGAQVVAGSASVASSGTQMTVNQSTSSAVINWNKFDVGSQAGVTFNQPDASSRTLNRVLSSDPSQIYGTVKANGQLFFVNPNGVIVGPGARIEAGAVVASTLDTSNESFAKGENKFDRGDAQGAVVNQGTISAAPKGYVALVGAKVENKGAINAPQGQVALAAADRVVLPVTSSGLIGIEVDPATVQASITNETSGVITAADGQVFMKAEAAGNLGAQIVNKGRVEAASLKAASGSGSLFVDQNSNMQAERINIDASLITGAGSIVAAGSIASIELNAGYLSFAGKLSADSTTSNGGAIKITVGDSALFSGASQVTAKGLTKGGNVEIISNNGYVLVSGKVDVSSEKGAAGQIRLSGRGSTVLLGATLEANGASGGGIIHVGGGWAGQGTFLHSISTTVDKNTTISADATDSGMGGEVVVWSDGGTSFYGAINARGGQSGGDGGRVELSSADKLNVQISGENGVNVSNRKGGYKTGNIVIDPANVVIGDALPSFDIFRALMNTSGSLNQGGFPTLGEKGFGNIGHALDVNKKYALFGASSAYAGRGSAFLYSLATGLWIDLSTTAGQPITGLAINSTFGGSVALNETYALIGAPGVSTARGNAYLYNLGTGVWKDLATTAGQPITALATAASFAGSVALNDTYALIGASGVSTSRGRAYLYNLNTGTWLDLSTTAGQPITGLATYSFFGADVALANDYAALGAPGVSSYRGNAYLYRLSTGTWTNLGTTSGQLITGLAGSTYIGSAIDINDSYVIMGTTWNSAALLYNRVSGVWVNLATVSGSPAPGLAGSPCFGSAVALNSKMALIGAKGANKAYLYDLVGGTWTDLTATPGFIAIQSASDYEFGTDVAISESHALISMPGNSDLSGTAYLYNLSSGTWRDILPSRTRNRIEQNGMSGLGVVALNEKYALLGRSFEYSSRGNAYLYNLATGVWTDLSTTSNQPITSLSSFAMFGSSVALSSQYALIGTPNYNAGDVFLYNLTTGAWKVLVAGSAFSPEVGGGFAGGRIAVTDSYALVGAAYERGGSGEAYLYNIASTQWIKLSDTAASPLASLDTSSSAGTAVALNAQYALISAPGVASHRGNAYLYNLATGSWTTLSSTAGQPITSLAANDYFGWSVSLSSSYAIISAVQNNSSRGNAYLYNLDTGSWTNLRSTAGSPVPGLAAGASFGVSVAVWGDYAVIGATGDGTKGNAYLYKISTGAWTNLKTSAGAPLVTMENGSSFGSEVALNSEMALLMAGSSDMYENGYFYGLKTGLWRNMFAEPGRVAGKYANFGTLVALTDTHALFSVDAASRVFLYSLSSGAWTDIVAASGSALPSFSVGAIALSGGYALVGNWAASGGGAAYLYNIATNTWLNLLSTAGAPSAGNFYFGQAVAVSDSYALISDTEYNNAKGNAYLYNIGTGVWTNLSSTAGQPITALADFSYFGSRVALSSTYALIAAGGVSAYRGNAYLYKLSDGTWTNLASTAGQPITALAANSNVGSGLALNATYALIGASGISSGRGNAYLYNLTNGTWLNLGTTVGQPITAAGANAHIGTSVAINGDYVLLNAPGVASTRGNAYLYRISTGAWTNMASTAGEPITWGRSWDFSYTVALNSTHALFSAYKESYTAGNAYFYEIANGKWTDLSFQLGHNTPQTATDTHLGTQIALNDSYALLGAAGYGSGRGNAYLYVFETNRWVDLSTTYNQPITALAAGASFGSSVAVTDQYALIGSSGEQSGRGNAYLYNIKTWEWIKLAQTAGQPITGLAASSAFGASAALNSTYALLGASGVSSGRGNCYLYNLQTGAWVDLSASAGTPITGLAANDAFGNSVALNENYALIAAKGISTSRGNAYLYKLSDGQWTNLAASAGQPITALAGGSLFGTSVALSSTYALIGASGISSGRGNAYLYKLADGQWTDLALTTGQPISTLGAGASLGQSVAINETSILLGAQGVVSGRGNAYLYNLSSTKWSDLTSVQGEQITALGAGAAFGSAVALNSTYALIGASGALSGYGNAYLVRLSSIGQNLITSDTIKAGLASGMVTITADNSLTILNVDVRGANVMRGLMLQSGGSFVVEGASYFGGRYVWLIANTDNASLGDPSARADGPAGITVKSTGSIDNQYGSLVLGIGQAGSTGRTGSSATAGQFVLDGPIAAGSIYIRGDESGISLTSTLTATSAGKSIMLIGSSLNMSGAATLNPTSGNWAVYNTQTGSLGTVSLNGLTRDYNRYGCTIDAGCAAGTSVPATGNGVVYAYAPTVTVSGLATISKAYDGTAGASLAGSSLSGFVNGDSFTLSAAYADKNAGTGIGITYTPSSNMGYLLAGTMPATGAITPAQLSVTGISASNKVYDATTSVSVDLGAASLSGVIGAEIVTLDTSGYAASFASGNVGNGVPVVITGLGLSGANAGNYVIVQPVGVTANITPASVTYTMGQTTVAQGTLPVMPVVFGGLKGSDSLTGVITLYKPDLSIIPLSANLAAGTYTAEVTSLSGAMSINYILAGMGNIGGVLTITSAPAIPASNESPATSGTTAQYREISTFIMDERRAAWTPSLDRLDIKSFLLGTKDLIRTNEAVLLFVPEDKLENGVDLLGALQLQMPMLTEVRSVLAANDPTPAPFVYDKATGRLSMSATSAVQNLEITADDRASSRSKVRVLLVSDVEKAKASQHTPLTRY